ncbi:right-handed parallel beta-helix repeat-containing protein [Ruania halotolerans]|uniref:right-handed parallel beta-helix repeat-containing protein n=1 Tax=Ruania halotolerans TaxID=2897773 RepID=UPI001E442131|nr:right-handed parallel beta-helix repeat-containing protein [Ruania halotolerans]UFU07372.1 right-handed parallel beta-helix repeat-containing protein [Ruania halotolerans]
MATVGVIEIIRDDVVVASYPTIQDAVDAAQAGDVVQLSAGTYFENVVIDEVHGTANDPIVIQAAPGEEVIVNGADPRLLEPNDLWEHHGDGVYSVDVPWMGDADKSLVSWVTRDSDTLLAAHYDMDIFDEGPRGEDKSHRDGSTLWVSLDGGQDPGDIPISVGTSDGVFRVENSTHIAISGLTVRGGGFAGIYLKGDGYQHVTIDDIDVRNVFRGVSTDDEQDAGTHVEVRDSSITNAWPSDWLWDGYYDSGSSSDELLAPMRAHAIVMKASDSSVHGNILDGGWDGMQVQGHDIQVYGNSVSNMKDDGIELESNNSARIEVFENTFWDTYVGFSIVSDSPGPIYIYRNTFSTNKLSYFKPREGQDWRYGYSIKNGRDWGAGAENVRVYQNSFFDMRMSLFDTQRAYEWSNFEYYNNIFYTVGERDEVGTRERAQFTNTELAADGNNWNGNLYYSERSPMLFNDWDGEGSCSTIHECRQLSPVFESLGIQADPMFEDLDTTPGAYNELRTMPGSPVRDAGTTTPQDNGWPDTVTVADGSPDIGRYELASPPPTGAAPPAPDGLEVDEVTPYRVTLDWEGAPGEDIRGYNVYRSTDASFTPAAGNRIATWVPESTYTDRDGLVAESTYTYVVSAVSDEGMESDSSPVSAQVPEDVVPPATPGALLGAWQPDGSIVLDWADSPEEDFAEYRIYRSSSAEFTGAGTEQIATVDAVSHFTDDQPLSSSVHTYWVTAADQVGLESDPVRLRLGTSPSEYSEVLLLVQNTTLSAADAEHTARLRALGAEVTILDHNGLTGDEADGYDLLVISPTVYVSRITDRFNDADVPVVLSDYGLLDEMAFTTTSGVNQEQGTSMTVDSQAGDLAAGLAGSVDVTVRPTSLGSGGPLPGAQVAATFADGTSGQFAYETGVPLADGVPAPERRAFTFLMDRTAQVVTSDGWALFDAAVRWAGELPVAPEPPVEPAGPATDVPREGRLFANPADARDGDFTLTMSIPHGQNAHTVRLFENGEPIAGRDLVDDTPWSQRASFPVTGRENGRYTYTCELENQHGVSECRDWDARVTSAG